MSIGARSQSARTYLEKKLDDFGDCELEPLVAHGLRALRDTLPKEVDLTNKNVSIAIVGEDMEFVVNEDSDVDKYLELIAGEEQVKKELKFKFNYRIFSVLHQNVETKLFSHYIQAGGGDEAGEGDAAADDDTPAGEMETD